MQCGILDWTPERNNSISGKMQIHIQINNIISTLISWFWQVKEGESESHSLVFGSLRPHELYSPWNSPGQNTGVGSLCLLQGIFPTQVSNPGLPHCRRSLYQFSHKGSPRILELVAYPFSSRSSRPRNWTGVSCIASRLFINWAISSVQFSSVAQSCPTLCDPKNHSTPGLPIHGRH